MRLSMLGLYDTTCAERPSARASAARATSLSKNLRDRRNLGEGLLAGMSRPRFVLVVIDGRRRGLLLLLLWFGQLR